ncbi:hypothetical protein O3M35_009766 [Rhynocoris fuscipes]|uniref:Uncharacterized protein n=1 Tax=Rhynocoris fuscipes TaxID=488301 RepID=A0AAW1DA15_9HEMI
MQLRLCNKETIKIFLEGNAHIIKTDDIYSICNLNEAESLSHMFFKCPIYRVSGSTFVSPLVSPNNNDSNKNDDDLLASVLSMKSDQQVKNVFYYTCVKYLKLDRLF